MSKIKELIIISTQQEESPPCDVIHNTTAIVFSAGGYTGNIFHEFNEGFLPLFITIQSKSLTKQDVTLVIENSRDWWVTKYTDLLTAFSNYPIINLNNEKTTHCFKSGILGLESHGFMTINPEKNANSDCRTASHTLPFRFCGKWVNPKRLMPNPTNIVDFHNFLNNAYAKTHHNMLQHPLGRPKLVLISRPNGIGRVMLNEVETKDLAEAIGFKVIVFEPRPEIPMSETFRLLNESHVLVGVHGAALTHLLFLRPGAVFIQVVPIGTNAVAEMCYGKPAKEMGLHYMEYKISIKESSLVNKYNELDPILQDPMSLSKKFGWGFFKRVYLKEQDVKLDLIMFKKYLEYAYEKAKRFMYEVEQ